jgi:acetyl-CoA C-acetyltransferase
MVNWLSDWRSARNWHTRLNVLTHLRTGHLTPVIALLRGLSDPIVGLSMGQTAEILAHRFSITREKMDAFSIESHMRLANAQDNGHLSEIETIYDGRGNYYDKDDGLRRDSSKEGLAKLKPVFDREVGKVTAGNSAQVTDGAALLILASREAVDKYNLPVLGRIVDCMWAGLDPSQMGLGPAHAVVPLLKEHHLKPDQIDYWEINEAFAGQVLACLAAWKDKEYCAAELGLNSTFGKIDSERLNVDGGGISMGHPVGATGARIVLHLLQVLKREKAIRGVATLCIGGGQGGAMLVERDED